MEEGAADVRTTTRGAEGPSSASVRGRLSGLPARLDAVTRMAERSQVLASIGQIVGGLFDRVVRPGPVKDLLAGSWLRHPLHPVLTDVPIGAWTAAEALEVIGGPRYEAAVNGLVGFGVAASIPTVVTGLSELSDVGTERDRALGTLHALTNICASLLFGASYIARREHVEHQLRQHLDALAPALRRAAARLMLPDFDRADRIGEL